MNPTVFFSHLIGLRTMQIQTVRDACLDSVPHCWEIGVCVCVCMIYNASFDTPARIPPSAVRVERAPDNYKHQKLVFYVNEPVVMGFMYKLTAHRQLH